MNFVRWGVLSTAKIATNAVIPAMQQGQNSRVMAIASRSKRKARQAARALDISKAHGSYERLLQDPDIDAVYIPLPNHLHVPWTIKSLQAGKHVLCEKPIGLDAGQAAQVLEASRNHPDLKVMEAFMYRHHPQWQRALQLVREGEIGEVRTIQSFFSYYNVDPDDIRNQAEIGGGGLLDIGCYCISLSRFIFDAEPDRVLGKIVLDPDFNIDRLTSAILDFNPGTATFTCGTQLALYQHVDIVGDEGRIEISRPFNPTSGGATRIKLHQGQENQVITLDPADHYTIQGNLFSRAILEDTPVPTPLEDALANMQVIDDLRLSADKGTWV